MPDAERPRLESVKILNRQASSIFCALPPEFFISILLRSLISIFSSLIFYNVLSQIFMENFLVVLYPRLIKRIYIFHGPFIGNGEEEEIHQCPNVEWCQFADGNVTAHVALLMFAMVVFRIAIHADTVILLMYYTALNNTWKTWL